MRIVFMGTPDFAVAALAERSYHPVAARDLQRLDTLHLGESVPTAGRRPPVAVCRGASLPRGSAC